MNPRVVILASGGGSTAEAFIRACETGSISVEVVRIFVSRRDAGIFERIKNLNAELGTQIVCTLVNAHTHPAAPGEAMARGQQTAAEENALIDQINLEKADCVVLMGYMKRLGPKIVRTFGWRSNYTNPYRAMLLNTHPGLFPETKGLYGSLCQEKVLELSLPEAGQTLHIVSEQYDDGPTVAEHRIPVNSDDTAESLFDRVQITEKRFLPHDIESFIQNRLQFLTSQEI